MMRGQLGFPIAETVEIHFTYPPNGNYHFSLKDRPLNHGGRYTEHAYFDKIVRKEYDAGQRLPRLEIHSPRVENNGDWHQLMPSFVGPTYEQFATQETMFAFPSMGIGIVGSQLKGTPFERVPVTMPKPGDTCVDVTTLGAGTLSVSASLRGQRSRKDWLALPDGQVLATPVDETIYPHIAIEAVFYPTRG